MLQVCIADAGVPIKRRSKVYYMSAIDPVSRRLGVGVPDAHIKVRRPGESECSLDVIHRHRLHLDAITLLIQ